MYSKMLTLMFTYIKIIVSREKAVHDMWFKFNPTFAWNCQSVIHIKLRFLMASQEYRSCQAAFGSRLASGSFVKLSEI